MDLSQFDGKPVRLKTVEGDTFEGVGSFFPAEYGLREYGREEDGLRLGEHVVFAGETAALEPLDAALLCGFYGAEHVPEAVRALYRLLRHVWCAETCAPRLRPGWSPDNPTLGQCSITAFLAQDLFGGEVYGVPLPEGGVHCFNRVGDYTFDLASEQFGDTKLDYENTSQQLRTAHFADADKLTRYKLLKQRLTARQQNGAV